MSELNMAPRPSETFRPGGVLVGGMEGDTHPQTRETGAVDAGSSEHGLSFSQRQVWLHAQVASGVPLYNRALVLTRRGPVQQKALERALAEISRRHEMLRTAFATRDGIPVPTIAENQAVNLSVTELKALPEKELQAEIRSIAEEEVRRAFDLAKAPLTRARLLRLGLDRHFLIVTLHTLVADDQSLCVYAKEFGALYEAYSGGKCSPLPELPLQFADFVTWQRRRSPENTLGPEISYWRERLAGIPALLELPTDRPRPPAQTFRGARETILLPEAIKRGLDRLCDREGVSRLVVLLAAFQTLLSRYTRQDDIVVGSIVSDREEFRAEDLIGLFATTLVIRAELGDDPTFRKLLVRVSELVEAARKHRNVPLDRLVSEVQPDWDPSRNPLFQALFSLEATAESPSSGWEVADLDVDNGTTKVDLQLQLRDRAEGLEARFTYSTDLFDAATIVRMAGHFQRLLEGVVTNPDERISRMPLLTDAERHQLVAEWNNTRSDYPKDLCVHQCFEKQVACTPDSTAVVFEKELLSYRELDTRANQLANHLRRLGVGADSLVGICLERSLEMVVGLLGILKAGAAYVPIDPAYPGDRVSFMLEDAEVPVLITQKRLIENLQAGKARVVLIDSDWREVAEQSSQSPGLTTQPENRAYVIYTSGSTGKPKGVEVLHRAVVNFLTTMAECPGMTVDDKLLAVTTLSFDIAGLEIFLPLSVGASVEIVSREVSSDGRQLRARLASSDATVMQATPATWRMLLEAGWEGRRGLKVLCGGEAVSRKLAEQLLQKTGSLWNMYGPTETTIWSTTCKVEHSQNAVTIGRPIANTEIFILDKALQPVPIGVAGELHIGGDGLARGYLKRPELTAEKFIANPFSPEPGRLYKTGDLVRYLPNGEIEFLGRIDHQIKIRGFRIELGEIEAVLRQHPAVSETVVVVREDSPGDQRLVAYFVPSQESASTVSELRQFLKEKLPEYMVPSIFVALPTMPLTPNGKVNRRALPAPNQGDIAGTERLAAPADSLEAQLVKIWESVLGVRPIGVKHNFFELGGHSLVAVKLMHRIERAFGRNLPIATLLQAPTIEKLAGILRQKGWSPRWTCLVPIQTGGSRLPFFCVHGANGAVVRFHDLSRHLGPDQPFYGLQALGLDEKQPLHTRTEDMAAQYIREIQTIYPDGPYILGGYSYGGTIAFEMAQQLAVQGQEAVVVLFDTGLPLQGTAQSRDTASATSILLDLFQIPAGQRRNYILRIATAPIRAIQRRLHVARLPRRVKEVRRACLQAQREYSPRIYSGRVILFRSDHKPLGQLVDPREGWRRYAACGLEVYEIKGNHENILLEPQVRSVAEQLKACLTDEQLTPAAVQLVNA
jgi:amino acid adenylation domain-containing protein